MRITALKTVYWDDGFEVKTGKVKTVSEHHAEVQATNGLTYLVAINKLSTSPLERKASGNKKIIIAE